MKIQFKDYKIKKIKNSFSFDITFFLRFSLYEEFSSFIGATVISGKQ